MKKILMQEALAPIFVTLPGIGNSGPSHWQTLWEKANPTWIRVQQRDWDHPVCEEWLMGLESSLSGLGLPRVILIAHSLASILVAHWAIKTKLQTRLSVQGALLVAPPDPHGPNFPKEAVGFSPLPLQTLGFPSIVVASSNDPYGSLEFAQSCASAWGSQFVCIGAVGHINSASGLGDWPEGLTLLEQLAN